MTLPDMIQAPRAVATDAVAKAGSAEAGKAAGKAQGKGDFAAALADMMGAPSAEAAAAAPGEAEAGAAVAAVAEGDPGTAMLDDLAAAAVLLPAVVTGETVVTGEGEAVATPDPAQVEVPGAAVQALLAGLVVKPAPAGAETAIEGTGEGLAAGEEAEAETDATAEAEALVQEVLTDPVAALAGVAPVATEVPLAEGEAEVALGSAVTAAVAGGVVQPMAAQQVRMATLPGGGAETAQQAAANGMESSAQAIEGNRPDFAEGEGEGADPGAKREMTAIQQALVAAERPAAAKAATLAAEAKAEVAAAVTAATSAGAAQAVPQSGQAMAQQPVGMANMPGNPAPIAMMRPGWEGAIAERIEAELSGDGQIELDLTPEHLGRLKIRLDMVDGQTMVRFVTETTEAARLIQQNEHRLSESLSRAGLSLGGQETASRDPQGERQARGGGEGGGMIYERPAEAKVGTMAVPGRAAPGLVNLVA